jgi:hypothetical protein
MVWASPDDQTVPLAGEVIWMARAAAAKRRRVEASMVKRKVGKMKVKVKVKE